MKKSEIYKYTHKIKSKLGLSDQWTYTNEDELRNLIDVCIKYHFKQFNWVCDDINQTLSVVQSLVDSKDDNDFIIALEILYNLERK